MNKHTTDPGRFIGLTTAVLLVIANTVGTGVFTTLGIQAAALPDGAALLALWITGAVVALCGALSYAELAAALPRSGGEYHFLARIFHPVLGQLAGLVSVTVGFAAPVALAAVALGRYASAVVPLDSKWVALTAVVVVTVAHALNRELGRALQVIATMVKVALILGFCAFALTGPAEPGTLSIVPDGDTLQAILSAPFGLSLIYVSYAYFGWNAAAYVISEVRDPFRTVPRALILGTLAVAVLYLLLNWVFLRSIPFAELAGTVEVGALAAGNLFGSVVGAQFSLVISLLLISTISALTLAGPRVLQTLGEDIPALKWLAERNRRGAPTRAVVVQLVLAVAFILTDSFEGVLTITGFTLTVFSCLSVAGLLWLRVREPELPRPFRVPLYPATPLAFLAMGAFALTAATLERPLTVVSVLGALGLIGILLARGFRSD